MSAANNLRKHSRVIDIVDRDHGFLTDLSRKHEVKINWKLNRQAQRDNVFKLTVDDKEVYLDLEELIFYTRVMFIK